MVNTQLRSRYLSPGHHSDGRSLTGDLGTGFQGIANLATARFNCKARPLLALCERLSWPLAGLVHNI